MAKKVIKDTKINSWVEFKYLKMKRKYLTSMTGFILLNVTALSVSAALIILNLFALRLNEFDSSKPYFIAIAIISGLVAFITAIISFFKFRKTSKEYKNKIEDINAEQEKHKAKKGEYALKDRDHILIKNITAIYNDEFVVNKETSE